MAARAAYGVGKNGKRTLMSYWKQGWNEIPEVMGSGFYGVMGLCMVAVGTWDYMRKEKYNHRYKTTLIVYRPEDNLVSRIRKFEDSPQPTRTPAALANKNC